MVYNNIHMGVFLSRPNRFIAEVEIDGQTEICHIKNTGRCKEILVPGATVYADYVNKPTRSTQYDLIAANKDDLLINIDSSAPNVAFGEYLRQGKLFENITLAKPEAKYGTSRFDFYVETAANKAFIEVKGVTLEENGIAMFPDAPTTRGIKHLNELAACIADGYEAYAVFIIQMKGITQFTPNYKTHQAFGDTLVEVAKAGVKVLAFDCDISPSEMVIGDPIPVKF